MKNNSDVQNTANVGNGVLADVRQRSAIWWNSLTIRDRWDLFYKYNPMIANAPANIGLWLDNIEKSHIDTIWEIENSA